MNKESIEVIIKETSKQILMRVVQEVRRRIEENYDKETYYNEHNEEIDSYLSNMYWARRQELLDLKTTLNAWIKEITT